MIRLNLGCGGPGLLSWHPIPDWINRDPDLDGWRFQDGLGEYADGSVEAISTSHCQMYMPLEDWPAFYAECARVLCDGGVMRVTEDDTRDTRSRTFPKGWRDAVTLTYPALVKQHMEAAGLVAVDTDATHTNFGDNSILQDQHGGEPHVFFAEGLRKTRILFEPHADDGSLFAAATIHRYRPRLITVFGSAGDYGDTWVRAKENEDAMSVLGAWPVEQWECHDYASVIERMRVVDGLHKPSLVFACNERASHPEHVFVAKAAREVFGRRLKTYHTYDVSGKVREGTRVEFSGDELHAKMRALCRYESQIRHDRARTFFEQDLVEYVQ